MLDDKVVLDMVDPVEVEMVETELVEALVSVNLLPDDVDSVVPVELDSGVMLVVHSLVSLVAPISKCLLMFLYTGEHKLRETAIQTRTQEHSCPNERSSDKTSSQHFLHGLHLQIWPTCARLNCRPHTTTGR